jgi:CheY-like chemotaxis protein
MKKYKSVLLVDDDQVSCFINDRILKTFGVTANIYTASNGKEALNFIQENTNNQHTFPDLILLDLHMPVMNGFEFMEDFSKIERKGAAPKVIILTSSANPVDRKKVEQYPILGYMNKPLLVEELNKFFE